ncbi:glycosyltransferase family 90 protein [Pseudohyphozyma bogoriensis]|nr:glycosyltransferase family 90 protein [Pseudohyphozyma bogoriensis]
MSQSTSPELDDGKFVPPSPFIGRTPKLEQGYGFDHPVRKSRGTKYSRRNTINDGILPWLLGLLLRLSKSPKVMLVLAVSGLTWLVVVTVKANSHVLAKVPVHQAFIPIIQQSGHLIHHISPATGSKIKSWTDNRILNDPNRPLTEEELEARSSHTFHPNGLLLVNPKGRHPIFVLIERAEKRWKEKLARQSRTLKDAVREYKSRYRRNPPKGFDDWWRFAEENNVQLRDEYDQIHKDLAPHWALEPHDNRHRNKVMQERDHTFTLAIVPGETMPKAYGQHAHLRRATDVAKVLSLFAANFPRPLNTTFIIDDNPAVMLNYAQRDRMVELSEQGEYYGPSEFIESEDTNLSNFAQACAINSPLRRSERGEFTPDYSGEAQRSFIWDHTKASDLCNHPEFRKLHGHTMEQGVPLGPIVPLFTFAKTTMHADILVTPLEQYSDTYIGYEPPWEGKSQNKLLWRGTTTGVEFDKKHPWKLSQRARLHLMSQNMDGDKEIIWSQRGAIRTSNMSVSSLNHLYMDTAFSGKPEQCDPETCEIMSKIIHFKPLIGLEESNQYKYLMDVDGNGWSGRFHRLMSTRSLVLKSTVFPEWYADRVEPWVHYAPIKVDYSDLYDVMAFFIGTPDGQGGHDSIAERIGQQGKDWAAKYWRREDMAAYMYRLLLEYSRILSVDQDEVDYIDPYALDI